MDNKDKYKQFCEKVYVPIYSKPWWMDTVCGKENWDVWLYEKGDNVLAAMPYYMERRGEYKYITKAPLTQNNGIIFKNVIPRKLYSRHSFEEKVINAAVEYIHALGVDVYEQQFTNTFDNWLPFFWSGYTAITRYSYIINSDDLNEDEIWDNISSKYKNKIRKSKKISYLKENLDYEKFYFEHEKIFKKQGLECPFSFEFWQGLYKACEENDCCKILYMSDMEGHILSLAFLVWDEKYVYQLLAGPIPEYSNLDTFDQLVFEGICLASKAGKKYDFEGSVIKRISKSMREFGGVPVPYFRIRKVFNEEILRNECEKQIMLLKNER